MVRLLRWLVHRLRPRLSVYCLACKRPCPVTEPESVLTWLDRHVCVATTGAVRMAESVVTGEPPRWE
jgi:hypothetical protein